MIEYFTNAFLNFFGFVGEVTEDIQTLINNLPNFISIIFTVLQTSILGFLTDSRDKFISIGSDFANVLGFGDMTIITDNFFFWICGIFIGLWLLKFIITTVVELVSKLIDPM